MFHIVVLKCQCMNLYDLIGYSGVLVASISLIPQIQQILNTKPSDFESLPYLAELEDIDVFFDRLKEHVTDENKTKTIKLIKNALTLLILYYKKNFTWR